MNSVNLDKLTTQDAFFVVQELDELPVFDDQPSIEANSAQISVQTSFDTNFQDREAFVTGVSKYIEEATRHGVFNDMLAEGFQHAANLYTWRCISRSVPTVQSNDDPARNAINQRVCQVLGPHIDKLFEFMEFTNKAINRFCDEIARLCHPEKRKDFVSESYLMTLGKFLNMLVVLDELKNMKASIKNDMSTFKRATQALQSNGMEMMSFQKVHDLSLFLATQHKVKENLKERLVQIEGFEDVLADVINICVYFFENQIYITADEKHMFVKVIAFSLFLIDGNGDNVKKLDQSKRLSIQKLDKLLKTLEAVPLFGDMQIQPFSFVKRSQFYNPSKWPLCSSLSNTCHINILEKVRVTRKHHDEFVTHLARIKNDMTIVEPDQPRTDEENKEITELCLNGLRLLCDWTSSVIELVSWKLDNPAKPETHPECPPESASYARATTYNYTPSEKAALVEMIAMIKGVQLQLSRLEADFATPIRKHIYAEVQDFVQLTLREPLHKAVKHKKDMISTIINSIIDTCADASNLTMSKSMEFSSKKKSKKEQSQSLSDLSSKRRREVPPSSTQLYLTRTMLESLVSEKSGGRRLRKDIDPKHLEKMFLFLRQSYYWPCLLSFSQTLANCCDLSQFWFREFYLEMSMGEQIQFPIEMSIPWILTDYVLTSQDPSLMECLLYQLDLYNDAAAYSLSKFRKQHLYDEVEAEVNLCFDQFVFKLSEAVFQHYKQLAASMLLDKGFKADCTRMGITLRTPPAARFETLLKQRHVQLLGRSIDLNRLISQRIDVALARSLDVAISRFESEGLWYIVPLDAMIETNRLCHHLLSEHLHSLADFDDMLTEANHQVNSTNGRTTLHIFNEMSGDLMPNYYYNSFTQRFVKGRLRYRNEPHRDKPPSVPPVFEFGSKSLNAAFANICAMHKNYIGLTHFATMAKFMGYQGIATVIDEMLMLARQIIDEQIKPHVRILYNLSPKILKLPRYDYGAEAILQYYLQPAKSIVAYEPLKKEFAQGLRELGNLITFCLQLESGLGKEDMIDLFNSAPFTKCIPKPPFKCEWV
uniref:CYRIA-B_Rac1-bd domain-containing protein n=1 Tax=Bursaphelenchus xylophilus TaxID=6326 RepID=A0A1I7RJ05_BURXY